MWNLVNNFQVGYHIQVIDFNEGLYLKGSEDDHNARKKMYMSAHCTLVWESPWKTQCNQALDETLLYLHSEKETEQYRWHRVVMAGRSVSIPRGNWPMCTLLVLPW